MSKNAARTLGKTYTAFIVRDSNGRRFLNRKVYSGRVRGIWRRKFSWERKFKTHSRARKNPRTGEKTQRCRVRARYIKKGAGIFCESTRVKYAFIDSHSGNYKINDLCRALEAKESGYYDWNKS